MANQWIILLFIGYAIAAPWPLPEPLAELSDQEKLELKLREIMDNPDAPPNDKIEAINTEEDVTAYEYDIRLTEEQKDVVDLTTTGDEDGKFVDGILKRSTTHASVNYVWIGRNIPYIIDSSIDNSTANLIRQAIDIIHNKSCVQWVERKNEPYYVWFKKDAGCWSYVGRVGLSQGYQEISVGTGCEHVGIILHEMLHAMGFWHEQSRPDRNSQVKIMWENIKLGKENNFNKMDTGTVTAQDTPYDFHSIMMYANYAFSKNGQMTIQSIKNPADVFGQRNGLSDTDVLALYRMYSCNVTDGGWSHWSEYGPCGSSCVKSRNRFCTNSVSKAACNVTFSTGKQIEPKECPHDECYAPVDAHWGRWGDWKECSEQCGLGTKRRTRLCDDPPAKYGGKTCPGSNTEDGSCILKECDAGDADCGFDDFNAKYCKWEQDPSDNKVTYHDWMVGSFTPSGKTGPQSGDHTTGNGMFLYSEGSDCLNTQGRFVRLLSKVLQPTGSSGSCFTFWHYAYGERMGEFNVFVKTSSKETRIGGFAAENNQGQLWKQTKYHFVETENYKIVLESRCGADYRSDFAIDDIKLISGACPA